MRYRSLAVAVLAAGAFAIGSGAAYAETTTETRSVGADTALNLSYMGAYPSLAECEAAGQRFLGVDHFCIEGNNDGRPVWELWVESNRP